MGCVPGELPGWESTTKVNDTYQSLMARLIIYQSDIKFLSIIYTNTIYIHRELLYTIDMSTWGEGGGPSMGVQLRIYNYAIRKINDHLHFMVIVKKAFF